MKTGLAKIEFVGPPRYKARIEKYCRSFGRENVTVKEFDRDLLEEGDVVSDFASFLGVAHPNPNMEPRNESLSFEAMKLVFYFNRMCGVTSGDSLLFKGSEKFRSQIGRAYRHGQKIDKTRFLEIADFSEVGYVEKKFGIAFPKPAPRDGTTVGDLEDWLCDIGDIDLAPLDAALQEKGIEGDFKTVDQKLMRLFYSYLIEEHTSQKLETALQSGLAKHVYKAVSRSPRLERSLRRVANRIVAATGRTRS